MKKVKMLTLSAGPNGVVQAGMVIEVDDKEAKLLVEGGFAEYVEAGEFDGFKTGDTSGGRAGKSRRNKNVSED